MKIVAILAGIAASAIATALVMRIYAAGTEGAPGFFGRGVLIADINLAIEVLLVLGLTLGLYLARRGKIEAHRVNQTIWVFVNASLVVFMMVSSMQDVQLKRVGDLAEMRVWIAWLHALVGTFTVMAGLWLVLQMNDILPRAMHIAGWKRLMRLTLAGYWTVALLGFITYYIWYAGT